MYNKKLIARPLGYLFIFLCICLLFLSSCNPTKRLKPGELFLQKVQIKTDTRKVDKDELSSIIKQNSNKKILGLFRFHLGVYNLFKEDSKSKFKESIGEAPVIYDSLLTQRTVKQLGLYMKNRGYYDNTVTYSTSIKKNKIKIKYNIEAGVPYLTKTVKYDIKDKELEPKVISKHYQSIIKKEQPIDIDKLDSERDRIRKVLRNEGYYYFNKDYVKFKVDSTIGNKHVLITTQVLDKKNSDSSSVSNEDLKHQQYSLHDIDVYLSNNFNNNDLEAFDTISYNGLTIHYESKKLKYRSRMLRHAISLKSGRLYSLDNQQDTYKHLSELKLFKTTSIQFDDTKDNQLNSKIFLTPQKIKSLSFETIGTNSGGNLGLEVGVIYLNKNLFNGGERLTIKLRGGLEIQQLINETEESIDAQANFLGIFNTLEFGPEVNLEIPRLLLPISLERFLRKRNPKTFFNYLLNFQERPEYIRNLTTLSFGYFWNSKKHIKHSINPFSFSLIKLNLTPDFEERILNENNPFIVNSFTDHFISSTSYSFTYSNQDINKIKDFKYLRVNLESSGNLLSLYHSTANTPKNENDGVEIFGIQYSQFFKADIDYRYYKTNPLTSLVSRVSIGVGKPYGNLSVLPFEKSYYGGGANDIRAWQARTLGPGSLPKSFTDSNVVNQIGELKIEANIEYRFDLTKLLEGAVFVDAGNIWLLKPDEQRPNANINLNRFWQDVAVGVGFGLRLDFNFFLIRFDVAAKYKDPSSDKPKNFRLDWKEPNLNLGIGYPF